MPLFAKGALLKRIVSYSFVALLAIQAGCSSSPKSAEADAKAATLLFEEGQKAMKKKQWITAIQRFEELEARFPYGPQTQQGQIDIATAYYENEEYDNAIAASTRFLRLHPLDERADYAWYLQGICNFERGQGLLESWFPRRLSRTDSVNMNRAFENFNIVLNEYPDSDYADDARQRMLYLSNELALHELEVAKYYYNRGATAATVNRVHFLMQNYPRSPYQIEALELLADAYQAQGLTDLEKQTRDIISLNQ